MSEQETVPEDVIEALEEIRFSGIVNMYNRRAVIALAQDMSPLTAAQWLRENRDRYGDALNALAAWRRQRFGS